MIQDTDLEHSVLKNGSAKGTFMGLESPSFSPSKTQTRRLQNTNGLERMITLCFQMKV